MLQPRRLTLGDRWFQAAVLVTVCLEIIVFFEPAPVDAAIGLCLLFGLMAHKLDFRNISAPAVLSLTVFAVANIASLYDPLDMDWAVRYLFITLYLVASWFFFTGVASRYGFEFSQRVIRWYSIAGLISAFLGVGAYFGLLPFRDILLLNGRARGLFKDCNVYGPYFVPMVIFGLTKLTDAAMPVARRVESGLYVAAGAVGMLVCFSRACWMNFAVALVIYLGGQLLWLTPPPERARRIRKGVIAAAICAPLLLLVLNTPAVSKMMAIRVSGNGLQSYDRVRFATHDLALATAEERPFGIGPGQSEQQFGYATHSMYLRVLSENGFLGLAAILVFVAITGLRALGLARQAQSPLVREFNLVLFACIVGHLVNSDVIDTVHWRHIWLIYGLAWTPAISTGTARTAAAFRAVTLKRRPVPQPYQGVGV
jgi:hypothetical protein